MPRVSPWGRRLVKLGLSYSNPEPDNVKSVECFNRVVRMGQSPGVRGVIVFRKTHGGIDRIYCSNTNKLSERGGCPWEKRGSS